jgi:hypothetical protein
MQIESPESCGRNVSRKRETFHKRGAYLRGFAPSTAVAANFECRISDFEFRMKMRVND